ncbi:unnamed protein product [Mucor circinelloides]
MPETGDQDTKDTPFFKYHHLKAIQDNDSKYLGQANVAKSPPQNGGNKEASPFLDEEEQDWMTHNRLPTVPLSAAVDDTPADMKTAYKDEAIAAELRELYNTFQKCLDLREKYMTKSKQRFEDNPKTRLIGKYTLHLLHHLGRYRPPMNWHDERKRKRSVKLIPSLL